MRLNEHDNELKERKISIKRGITIRVKLLLKRLIFEYDIGMLKKLQMNCHIKKYKKHKVKL